jgi:nitroreductase
MSSIFKRRSVRKFLKEEIPQEDIREILKAGMAAPSAKNNQDWVFIFIEDQADIERFIQVHPNGFAMRPAPVNILVCADKNKNKNPAFDWGMLDAAAAMENMLIMATELGYGSLWVGVVPDPKRITCIREICSLPEHISPVGIVSVGKADKEKEPIDRYLEDVVFHGKYGQK